MNERKEEILFGEPFDDFPYVTLSDEQVNEILKVTEQIDRIVTPETLKLTANQASLGFMGEMAVAKYYDLDFNILKGESDGGYDFHVYHTPSDKSGTIDVKTISYAGGDLLIPQRHKINADVYLLVEKRNDAFGLIGTAKASQVAKATIKDEREGFKCPTRVVSRPRLTPVPEPDKLLDV